MGWPFEGGACSGVRLRVSGSAGRDGGGSHGLVCVVVPSTETVVPAVSASTGTSVVLVAVVVSVRWTICRLPPRSLTAIVLPWTLTTFPITTGPELVAVESPEALGAVGAVLFRITAPAPPGKPPAGKAPGPEVTAVVLASWCFWTRTPPVKDSARATPRTRRPFTSGMRRCWSRRRTELVVVEVPGRVRGVRVRVRPVAALEEVGHRRLGPCVFRVGHGFLTHGEGRRWGAAWRRDSPGRGRRTDRPRSPPRRRGRPSTVPRPVGRRRS